MGDSRRARRRRKGQRWQGLHPVTGKRWSLTAPTYGDLAELVARARRIGVEIRTGRLTPELALAECDELAGKKAVRLPRMLTVAEAWADYLPTVVHPHSAQKARTVWTRHLEKRFATTLVAQLTDGRLAELVAELATEGYSPKYITHSIWGFLCAAVRHARRSKKIERLPWESFTPPRPKTKRRPPAATRFEHFVALLLAARAEDERDRAAREAASPRRRALLTPLFDFERRFTVIGLCGLRNGEGAGLAWDHTEDLDDPARAVVVVEYQAIDQWQRHDGGTRPVRPTKNAKTEGPLRQRLHPDARLALLEQRAELKSLGWYRADGPVFPTLGGAWRKNANCIYPEDARRIALASGVPHADRWVTHSLRHSFGTLEILSGADPRSVQKRIGHASLRQLEQYVHGGEGAPSAIPRLPTRKELAGKTDPPRRPP